MVKRVNPKEYLTEEGEPQVNEYHTHYYQGRQESGSQVLKRFVYLGIFIGGLFIGYLMAKGE